MIELFFLILMSVATSSVPHVVPFLIQQAQQTPWEAWAKTVEERLARGEGAIKAIEHGIKTAKPAKPAVDGELTNRVVELEKVIADLQVVHTEKAETQLLKQDDQLSKQDDQLSKMDEILKRVADVASVIASNPNTPDLMDKILTPGNGINAVMTAILAWLGVMARQRTKAAKEAAASTATTADATVATANKIGAPIVVTDPQTKTEIPTTLVPPI